MAGKSFWSYIKSVHYDVGCTGGTAYVYNKGGFQIAALKTPANGNYAAFVPNRNQFIVKSADGYIAVYSLDEMKQIKKFRFSKMGNQHNGFCFSFDGSKLYVIENYNGLNTRLLVYETENYTEIDRLFEKHENRFLTHIECFENCIVLFGCMKNLGVISCGFVAMLDGKNMYNLKRLELRDYDYANAYKTLQLMGFTDKALKWSPLPQDREVTEFSLTDLF